MKNAVMLLGSPRKEGNTNALTKPFMDRLRADDWKVRAFDLHDMELNPCTACRTCQQDHSIFGCIHDDDMGQIFDAVMESELIVIATPVYSWYATPPVKTAMDRMVYGMNKFYGDKPGPALWAGKSVALITTCGYPPEKGADLLDEGLKRYCKHSQLRYLGMLVERHMGYGTQFMDGEKEKHAAAFAEKIMEQMG